MTGYTIRGGRVVDSVDGPWTVRDLHVSTSGLVDSAPDGAELIDAKDCYVAPGFVDLHTHVFSHRLFAHSRLQADRIGVRQGVACVIDAGSSGAVTIDSFPENVHATQATRVYAFINIGSPGLPGLNGGHASRPDLCDLSATVKSFDRHGDWLVGVKVLASASHTGSFGLEAVKLARKAADLVAKPMMLHVGNAPPLIDDVLDLLRPGDIVTHTYHGKVGGVLGYKDRVIDPFREAVARGAIVDLGHGRSSFSFRVFESALDQDMPLHTISSDLHRGNVDTHVLSLARTMTKMRMLGLSLGEVVDKVTRAPAKAVGIDRDGFGSLESGSATLFREADADIELMDAEGEVRRASRQIEPVGVLLDGVYHPVTEPI
jgi:dihydroorotase